MSDDCPFTPVDLDVIDACISFFEGNITHSKALIERVCQTEEGRDSIAGLLTAEIEMHCSHTPISVKDYLAMFRRMVHAEVAGQS